VHSTLLGEEGFKNLALQNHEKACKLYNLLEKAGFKIKNSAFFNEFVFYCQSAKQKLEKMEKHSFLGGVAISENEILVSTTEMLSNEAIERYIELLK
jgi:glycine dehydrogenase subunit 1